MASATKGVSIEDFLPSIPRTPPVRPSVPSKVNRPRRHNVTTTKPAAKADKSNKSGKNGARAATANFVGPVRSEPARPAVVTATVTEQPQPTVTSPPTAFTDDRHDLNHEEDRRTKFLRIGGGRMVNVLRSIRLLGNLGNTGTYEWTDNDVKTMRDAIEAQLEISFRKFERGQIVRLERTFRFDA